MMVAETVAIVLPDKPQKTDFPTQESLASRVMPMENGCIVWLGELNPRKGAIVVHRGKDISVARALWFYSHGSISPVHLIRTCKAAGCVSPEHRSPQAPNE